MFLEWYDPGRLQSDEKKLSSYFGCYDRFGYDGTDGIYVINYKGAGYVKRLQRGSNFVRIISDNKKYAEMTEGAESEDFRVVGKVRYVVHKVQG